MKIFKYRLPSGKHILIYRSKDNKSSDYFQYVEEYTKKDIEDNNNVCINVIW